MITLNNVSIYKEMLTLISSKTCPFAHRVEIVLKLAKIEDKINIVFVDPVFGKDGWKFVEPYNCDKGSSYQTDCMFTVKDVYKKYEPTRDRNFSIPILITSDKIYTESLQICKMLMPSLFTEDVDTLFEDFDARFSKAHYIAGHAKTADEYMSNYKLVFEYLKELDEKLANKYILGDEISIIDVVVYTHLCRFDAIYYTLFKLNDKHIRDYPNINRWICELLKLPAFSTTTDIEAAKRGYYLCEYHQPDKLTPFVPLGNGGFDIDLH